MIIWKAENEADLTKHFYLIDFDKNVLRQILNEEDISDRNKMKIHLFMKTPKILILFLQLKYILRKIVL